MDINFNKDTREYILGGVSYSKDEFIRYIDSDMLQTALSQHPGVIDTVNTNSTNASGVSTKRVSDGKNILLYGVPGSGKSWIIENEYSNSNSHSERIVFHPDYTNADFIGQILPVIDSVEKIVTYEFIPGPFTKIIREANDNPSKSYALIIEEINRGNAPAIFGDTFQLLDRLTENKMIDGVLYEVASSEYPIMNENMASYIYGNPKSKVFIPSNLTLIGTMNTSDQNTFTLDTAFQRRWRMRLVENTFDNVRSSLADAKILDTNVTWQVFCETINNIITGNKNRLASAEDKRLGVYFVHENELSHNQLLPSNGFNSLNDELKHLINLKKNAQIDTISNDRLRKIQDYFIQNRVFADKVIKYLWDDAFKFNGETLFDTDSYDSLEKIIQYFLVNNGNDRLKIFRQTVIDMLTK